VDTSSLLDEIGHAERDEERRRAAQGLAPLRPPRKREVVVASPSTPRRDGPRGGGPRGSGGHHGATRGGPSGHVQRTGPQAASSRSSGSSAAPRANGPHGGATRSDDARSGPRRDTTHEAARSGTGEVARMNGEPTLRGEAPRKRRRRRRSRGGAGAAVHDGARDGQRAPGDPPSDASSSRDHTAAARERSDAGSLPRVARDASADPGPRPDARAPHDASASSHGAADLVKKKRRRRRRRGPSEQGPTG
jgi:hypothetical protein